MTKTRLAPLLALYAGLLLAPAAQALVCPADFLEVSNALGELGCIQADVQRDVGGSVIQRTWPETNRACFADYGGRLPTPGEFTIAEDSVTMTSPTAPIWTDDVFFDGAENAVTARILAPGSIDYGFAPLTLNGFQRCWIPAEAQALSVVPSVGIWGLGALATALVLTVLVRLRDGGAVLGARASLRRGFARRPASYLRARRNEPAQARDARPIATPTPIPGSGTAIARG